MTPLQPPRPPATQPPNATTQSHPVQPLREPLSPPRSAEPPSQPCAAEPSSQGNTELPFDNFRQTYFSIHKIPFNNNELRLCDIFNLGKLAEFKQDFLKSPDRRRQLIECLVANTVSDSLAIREFLMIRLTAMESMPPDANSERLDKMLEHHMKMLDAVDHKILHSITLLDRLSSPGGGATASRIAVAVQNNVSVSSDNKQEKAVFPPHPVEEKNE